MKAGLSVWIRALAVALGVAGCAERTGEGPLVRPPSTVAVASPSIVIGGPSGYCIDRTASRLTGETPFVLLGACASIASDRRAGAPAQPGVLTAAVSPPGGGPALEQSLTQMKTFLGSPAGRAALARDGRSTSVQVLAIRQEGEALFVQLRDTGGNAVPGTDPTYWRGLMQVNSRLVTVSVMSFSDRPMSGATGLATLRAFVARIRRENGA